MLFEFFGVCLRIGCDLLCLFIWLVWVRCLLRCLLLVFSLMLFVWVRWCLLVFYCLFSYGCFGVCCFVFMICCVTAYFVYVWLIVLVDCVYIVRICFLFVCLNVCYFAFWVLFGMVRLCFVVFVYVVCLIVLLVWCYFVAIIRLWCLVNDCVFVFVCLWRGYLCVDYCWFCCLLLLRYWLLVVYVCLNYLCCLFNSFVDCLFWCYDLLWLLHLVYGWLLFVVCWLFALDIVLRVNCVVWFVGLSGLCLLSFVWLVICLFSCCDGWFSFLLVYLWWRVFTCAFTKVEFVCLIA